VRFCSGYEFENKGLVLNHCSSFITLVGENENVDVEKFSAISYDTMSSFDVANML
jgi:hypothetical protein